MRVPVAGAKVSRTGTVSIGLALVGSGLLVACPPLHVTVPPEPPGTAPDRQFQPAYVDPRWLADAPISAEFQDPGIEGLYAELRRDAEAPVRPLELAPYVRYESHDTPPNPAAFNLRQIVVKLAEGSAVRLREGKLRRVDEADALDTAARLGRSGLEPSEVVRDTATFNRLVAVAGGTVGRGVPGVEERDLFLLRRRAEQRSRQELPDMNLFYFVHLPVLDPERVQRLLAELRALRSVEVAYLQPIPFNAADIPPITNIDVTPSQGYFRPAPTGIDVDFARNFAAGRGNTIRIVDIEGGWHFGHEDLPRASFGFGVNWVDSHGTAVLGELVAEENGFGATGITPNAVFGASSVTALDPFQPIYFYSVANAAMVSLRALRPGDLVVIEQHFQHPFTGFVCTQSSDPCMKCSIPPWVATEEFAEEHAAYMNITRAGLIVVEAAGNGRMPVTPASPLDSGAIVVGAGNMALSPMCWSNFGPRVDVQAWGTGVGTLGYGPDPSLQANGGDPNQWYTNNFNGTSSATPIVSGAAALIQSIRLNAGRALLTSAEMRTLLASTGTPQAPAPAGTTLRNIGPQPDLRRAIQSFLPDAARFVRQDPVAAVVSPGASVSVTTTFKNAGGFPWPGNHRMGVVTASAGQPGFSSTPAALGSTNAPIQPEDDVTRTVAVTAPTQPGTYNLTVALTGLQNAVLATSPTRQIVVATATFDDARIAVLSAPTTMRTGLVMPVIVEVTNAGNIVWLPGTYSLALSRSLKATLPASSVAVPVAVPPTGKVTLSYVVGCNGPGLGFSSAQMRGPSGNFGQIAGRSLNCTSP